LGAYSGIFKSEIESAGYATITAEDNLFGQEDGASDYQVAAVVTGLHFNLCVCTPDQAAFGHLRGEARGEERRGEERRGDASMTIDG